MENTDINDTGLIRIERAFYEHKQLRKDFDYQRPKKPNTAKEWARQFRLKTCVGQSIPIFKWLFRYNWKTDFIKDCISGITVAVMHIPQGMAYAILGNVPPIVGIYMAFFPVLIYLIFGTSRHNSMGTFSVACLMTGKAVLEHSNPLYFDTSHNVTVLNPAEIDGYTPIQVATSVTFIVAIFQLAMYVLRLGVVSALLSDTLVSGFTTGAAVHVLVSQIKDLFGFQLPKFKGYFSNVNILIATFGALDTANVAAIVISVVTITISVLNNEFLKPVVAKVSAFPLPMELIAVVAGTLVSKYSFLQDIYGVQVVGNIPVGLPLAEPPRFELLPKLLVDGVSIAIVTYAIHLSMALIFAQKLDYEVDANQELLAMGISNVFGSFFSCMPFCASLSRSLIQQVVGGVTQIASLVSCLILLVILLWVGPFFEPLPRAVLASVIVVALKGMLMQVKDFWKFWKLSKIDAFVWMGTFLTVVFVGIDIGLLCGVVFSLTSIFILNLKPYTCLLGQVPNTDFYLDITRYKTAREIEGIKIFQYSGGINFVTRFMYRSELIRLIGVDPQKEVVYRAKLAKYLGKLEQKEDKMNTWTNKLRKVQNKVHQHLKCLILDFSSVSHVDPSGVAMLKALSDNFRKLGIAVYIASCKEPVYEMLTKIHPDDRAKPGFTSFPTLHDAVHFASDIFGSAPSSVLSVIETQ